MKSFFDSVRSSFGPLTANQVKGLNLLLDATADLSMSHRAYILATAWHETGPEDSPLHMTPRREIWGPTAAQSGYEGREDLGNTMPGDGKRFMGRGFVQITGRRNYDRASLLTGRDLVASPDIALEPEIAARIIVDGMTKGWFTGKRLDDYSNFRDMRRVVNGTDRADDISRIAAKFLAALTAGATKGEPPVLTDHPTPTPKGTIMDYISGFKTIIIGLLMAIVPVVATYVGGIDWNAILPAPWGMVVGGVVMVIMRMVTTTPVGVSKNK